MTYSILYFTCTSKLYKRKNEKASSIFGMWVENYTDRPGKEFWQHKTEQGLSPEFLNKGPDSKKPDNDFVVLYIVGGCRIHDDGNL